MPIDGATTGADWTDACTIQDVWQSDGGYAIVAGNDVYMSIQYGPPNQGHWSIPRHVGLGNWTLDAKATGVRFKDYVSGSHGTVSADVFTATEPTFSGTASGQATPASSSMITGIIPAAGTTPTAGSGFTYTHTNGTGVYVFTFTNPFANPPDVQATTASPRATNAVCSVTGVTANGFTVNTWVASTAVATDIGFSFLAVPVS